MVNEGISIRNESSRTVREEISDAYKDVADWRPWRGRAVQEGRTASSPGLCLI